jgi:DNA-binding MarR family transcriptional regulator
MGYFDSIYSSDLPHRARAVYMYLKDRTNKNGICWPSIKTIARELKLSRATVCRALDDLCKAGLLAKENRWRENGGKTSNLYKIQ